MKPNARKVTQCEMAKRGIAVPGCFGGYVKMRMGHKACSPGCAYALMIDDKRKKVKKESKKKLRADKLTFKQGELREWHNSKNSWSTAYWVHRWVRLVRDLHEPCISCCQHRTHYDAGHYRSRGAAGHLRYNLDNISKQCVRCNQHGGGTVGDYRIALVNKIGLLRVVALENNNAIKKWTIDECREIRDDYKSRCKAAQQHSGE